MFGSIYPELFQFKSGKLFGTPYIYVSIYLIGLSADSTTIDPFSSRDDYHEESARGAVPSTPEDLSPPNAFDVPPQTDLTNRNLYLNRFTQSWRLYAKANDIAKREKLKKALSDALKSMEAKKKNNLASITVDSVKRIQHAAKLLKEFKTMYKLSQNVVSSWKDYDKARQGLLEVGKTAEGQSLLKRYLVLRDKLSKAFKRSRISHPVTVLDDTIESPIVDEINDVVERNDIGTVETKKGSVAGPGSPTRKSIKTIKNTVSSKLKAYKDALKPSDAKEVARTAFVKAKQKLEKIRQKSENVKGGKNTNKIENSNDKRDTNPIAENTGYPTYKKSVLAQSHDESDQKGESLGHVHPKMAATRIVSKKTENEKEKKFVSPTDKENSFTSPTQKSEYKPSSTGPSSSLSKLLDSLGSPDEKLINKQLKPTNNHKTNIETYVETRKPTAKRKEISNDSNLSGKQVNQLTMSVTELNPTQKTEKEIKPTERQTSHPLGPANTNTKGPEHNLTNSTVTNSQDGQSVNKNETVHVTAPDAPNNATGRVSDTANTKPDSSYVQLKKLSETRIKENIAKTIKRQLETLKRLQEAKRARRRFEAARKELESKVKKLYDMAVTYEKPKDHEGLSAKTYINPTPDQDDPASHPGVALAGITHQSVDPVNTPSDTDDHRGFTMGSLDRDQVEGKGHAVDLQDPGQSDESGHVDKVYQVNLPNGVNVPDLGSKEKETQDEENSQKTLQALTNAIKQDLNEISDNEAKQIKEKKQEAELQRLLGPIMGYSGSNSKINKENDVLGDQKTVQKSSSPDFDLDAETTESSKAKSTTPSSGKTDEKDNDNAFKEVEDYLTRALDNVANQTNDDDRSKSEGTTEKKPSEEKKEDKAKEGVKNMEESKAQEETKSQEWSKIMEESKTQEEGKSRDETKTQDEAKNEEENKKKEEEENKKKEEEDNKKKEEEDNKKKEEEDNKKKEEEENKRKEEEENKEKEEEEKKQKEKDEKEKMMKIVEEAMKQHAKDPNNIHPINDSDLKDAKNETNKENHDKSFSTASSTAQVSDKGQNAVPTQSSDKSQTEPVKQSEAISDTTGPQNSAANADAIAKAEHMEEQVAKAQDRLYAEATGKDPYSSINPNEEKPLFSHEEDKEERDKERERPTYNEPSYHHHTRHHRPRYHDEAEDEEEDDPYEDEEEDEDEPDRESPDDEENEDEEYDDEDPSDKKKSRIQNIYGEMQTNLQKRKNVPEMKKGMMSSDSVRDELEDKKSIVPKIQDIQDGPDSIVTLVGNPLVRH